MLHRPITFQTTQTTTTPAASAFDDFNPTSSNTSSSRAAFLSALIHHQPQHPVMNHYPSQTSSGLPSPNFPPSKLPPAAPGSRTVSTRFPKERPFTPLVEDVFYPGDLIGQGLRLQGETITSPTNAPPQHFEVVRKLGTGSYAVVYLVREVTLFDSRSVDDLPLGELELDGVENPRSISMPGREYAIKCLSKANLDDDALEAQMLEATIHESLPTHHNIVTLHQTLETSSFLLLVLESVPGEDLFYFLEQSRDHDSDDGHSSSSHHSHTTATPPTPSLLSSANPSQLLAHRRLRLIASMFAQMCDAVATCHDVGVYHRDIKPENFIVTDGFVPGVDGLPERRVIVKLSDFGLATTDSESTDMDCGSAPYMSYECRNHCAPTYSPRDADVWSLGIVLINMLYHHNPWSDTSDGTFHAQCPSFASYLSSPVQFFMNQSRFPGMTRSVAQYLATNVFCLLDPPPHLQRARARARRTSAREFGAWVRNLPSHMAQPEDRTRSFSISPERRAALAGESGSPRSSRSRSLRPLSTDRDLLEQMSTDPLALTPELDPPRSSDSSVRSLPRLADDIYELPEVEASSRATSTRRRKRGARSANKGNRSRPGTSDGGTDAHLEGLAAASQDLARELSKTSKYASPMTPSMIRDPLAIMTPIKPPTRISSPTSFTPAKKSKWRDMFRSKESIVDVPPIPQPNFEDLSLREEKKRERSTSSRMSTKASNVTTMLLALDPPTAPQPVPEQEPSSSRGRTIEPRASPSIDVPSKPSSVQRSQGDRWPRPDRSPPRNRGPYDTPAGNGSTHSFGSPNASANKSTWRNSTATTSSYASSSAFTRFSNGSVRSVSTQATSVSALSWRSSAAQSKVSVAPSEKSNRSIPAAKEKPARGPLPPNVKRMDGIPWELHEVPRQMRVKPGKGDIFGAPPTKPRRATGASTARLPLDTISEKPRSAPKPPSPLHVVTTPSTMDLPSAPPSGNASSTSQAVSPTPAGNTSDLGNGERPKKVQKAQINTLAKMLSAFGKAR